VTAVVEELVHFDIEIDSDAGSVLVVEMEAEPKEQCNC